MFVTKVALVTIGALWVAVVVRRFAPTKRAHVGRAVTVWVFFALSFGTSEVLRRAGVTSWDDTFEALANVLVAVNVISAAGLTLFDVVLPKLRVGVPTIVSDMTMGGAYIAAAFAVMRSAGLELTGIVTTSAVVTGILALSLQATLGNVIGGVALQADNSIEVGDWLQLDGGAKGVVTKIGWRHTVVETNNWDTLIVPNATLLGSTITLLGKRGGERVPHRMWVYFNVDFRYAPNDVIRIVNNALRGAPIEGMSTAQPPSCVCMNFADAGRDSMAHYAARYHIDDMRIDDPTSSRVRARIYAALRRAEIPLAVPAAQVWVETDSEERRDRKLRTKLLRHRKALNTLPFLSSCSEEDLNDLAEHIDYVPFAAGEVVTAQGSVAHFLYVVVTGTVEVRVYVGETYDVVTTIKGPGYVGEMGLMTGTPRMATVVAVTDLECYRLDKSAFRRVLEKHPEMVEQISELLAARAVQLKAARKDLAQEIEAGNAATEKRRLVDNIRDFFGLQS